MAKHNIKDPRGQHLRLYNDIIDSPAWIALSASSKDIYISLRRTLGSTNNGDISATLSTLKHRGVNSSATLAKALRELETIGLIAKTRQGGIAYMSKQCTLYRFTDVDCYDIPKKHITAQKASNEWKCFTSLKQAEAALKAALKAAPPVLAKPNTSKVQNLKLLASDIEAMTPFITSDIEAVHAS